MRNLREIKPTNQRASHAREGQDGENTCFLNLGTCFLSLRACLLNLGTCFLSLRTCFLSLRTCFLTKCYHLLIAFIFASLLCSSSLAQDVSKMKSIYESNRSRIEQTHMSAKDRAQIEYMADLAVIQAEAQSNGELAGVLAVKKEVERLRVEAFGVMTPNADPKIVALQDQANVALKTADKTATADLLKLETQYMAGLERSIKSLTVAGNFDDAVVAQAEFDRIKARHFSAPAPVDRMAGVEQDPSGTGEGASLNDTGPEIDAEGYQTINTKLGNTSQAVTYLPGFGEAPPKFRNAKTLPVYFPKGRVEQNYALNVTVYAIEQKMKSSYYSSSIGGMTTSIRTYYFPRILINPKSMQITSAPEVEITYYRENNLGNYTTKSTVSLKDLGRQLIDGKASGFSEGSGVKIVIRDRDRVFWEGGTMPGFRETPATVMRVNKSLLQRPGGGSYPSTMATPSSSRSTTTLPRDTVTAQDLRYFKNRYRKRISPTRGLKESGRMGGGANRTQSGFKNSRGF